MIISPSRETGAVRQDPAYTPSLAHFKDDQTSIGSLAGRLFRATT